MTSASVWASYTLATRLGRCPSDGHLCYYEDRLKKKTQLLLFRPGPENEQQASSYFRKSIKKHGIFCCRRHCPRFFCWLGTGSLSLLVDSPVLCVLRVSRVWCVSHVSWRLHCFCCLFLLIVFVDLDACVVGDQGLDFAWSARGFLSRNVFLFVSTYRRRGDWCPCGDNRRREMSFVVILTTPSQRSCCVRWWGRLVASRQIVAMASLVAFEVFALQGSGVTCWERRW